MTTDTDANLRKSLREMVTFFGGVTEVSSFKTLYAGEQLSICRDVIANARLALQLSTPSPLPADEKIAEIEARLKAATPGPWGCIFEQFHDYVQAAPDNQPSNIVARISPYGTSDTTRHFNSLFIAHAPSDIAYLLERLRGVSK